MFDNESQEAPAQPEPAANNNQAAEAQHAPAPQTNSSDNQAQANAEGAAEFTAALIDLAKEGINAAKKGVDDGIKAARLMSGDASVVLEEGAKKQQKNQSSSTADAKEGLKNSGVGMGGPG